MIRPFFIFLGSRSESMARQNFRVSKGSHFDLGRVVSKM